MQDRLVIRLVDSQDRTIAKVNTAVKVWEEDSALREIFRTVARWHEYGAVGGYATDSDNNLIAYW